MGASSPANLLLVTFDQWRGDWGDPHHPVIALPALEKLSKTSWCANRCYTSSPHCVPARFSWLTGLTPSQLGVTRNVDVNLPPDAPSIVRDLRNQGYHTALVGKTHWTSHSKARDLREDLPLLKALGFDEVIEVAGPRALRRMQCALTDEWEREGVLDRQRADLTERYGNGHSPKAWSVRPSALPLHLYPDIWIAERSLEVLKTMPKDKPWLLWVSFVGPHEPFDTPMPWHGKNKKTKIPPPKAKPDWINNLPTDSVLLKQAKKWQGLLNEKTIDLCRRDYADHLQLLDDQLAKLITQLNKRVDAGKTAIAITADHGELLGDAGMLYKGTFLEGAIHVPWLYQPAGEIGKQMPAKYSKPVGLTGLVEETIKNLPRGGNVQPIIQWANRQKFVEVEFDGELLLLSGKRKIAITQNGSHLWAIDLAKDPEEIHNLIRTRNWKWIISFRWSRLRRQAKQAIGKRSKENWIWRDLQSKR